MPGTKASVTYKKKDGSLTIAEDKKYVFWTPAAPPSASPAVTIPVADITNLQQTPESSAKVALRIFVQNENYIFNFSDASNARKEQETITDILRNTIAANKASVAASLAPSNASTPVPANDGGGRSAAMAISSAIASKSADEDWYDDSKLMSDSTLQRSLLESDKNLKDRFNQSLRQKPESVTISQFTTRFWSTRLHLLRAHAIDLAQSRGEYNVLPEIGFVRKRAEKDGDPDIKQLQITKEQIKLIFKQYPIVSRAYNDNCPPLNPGEFWNRFFNSRLLKKLKGEKIMQYDPPDSVLDKYLDQAYGGPSSLARIPHFIDLEGNEQNHSQRKGNRPDQDMRPSANEKIPILRVLNNLSEGIMASVAPTDGEAHGPIGMDEETFEELRLQDLARNDIDNRVVLNIREQIHYGANRDLSADAQLYTKQDPVKVLSTLQTNLSVAFSDNHIHIDRLIGYQSDSDSDSDNENTPTRNGHRPPRVGSHAAMSGAMSTLLKSMQQARAAGSAPSETDPGGLSTATFEALQEVHNTTTEFLSHFWSLFRSGDATRAQELAEVMQALERSMDRLNAVGARADTERAEKVATMKKQLEERHRRATAAGRGARTAPPAVDWDAVVPGGKKAVDDMIRPTRQALAHATREYRKAYEEQSREAAAVQGSA